MTRAQGFIEAVDVRLAYGSLSTRADRDNARRCALEALVDVGMLDLSGVSVVMPEPDPIVELRWADAARDVNDLLVAGWRLFSATAVEDQSDGGLRALLGRPRSVAPDRNVSS